MNTLITISDRDIKLKAKYFISSMTMPGLNYKFIVVVVLN